MSEQIWTINSGSFSLSFCYSESWLEEAELFVMTRVSSITSFADIISVLVEEMVMSTTDKALCVVCNKGGVCKRTPNMPLQSLFQSSGATRKPIQYYYIILGLTPIIPRALRCHPAPFPCSDPGYQCRDAKAL